MAQSQKLSDDQILSNLTRDFHELVTNKEALRTAVENFYDNLIGDFTLGIIFDVHRKYKTKVYELDAEENDELEEDIADSDVTYLKKPFHECACPYCDRVVEASKFAPHLAGCMGLGRVTTRNSTRRVASNSKDRENRTYGGVPSDDEDDIDWNSGNKRGKKKRRNNGNKKSKIGTPKKCESPTITDEVEDEDAANSKDSVQDNYISSSTVDAVNDHQPSTSSKKKDKVKNRKSNKKDRSSPSLNVALD